VNAPDVQVPPPFEQAEGESWLVCHARPRCEKKFAALMQAERMAHYLPLVPSVRRYGTRTKEFSKPLFPGYVFARVPADRRSRIYQMELLARVIPIEDETRFLSQLHDVRRVVESGFEFTVYPLLTRGTRVKVSGGPLYGVEGVVDNPDNPQGIVVAIDVLRRGVLVRLPGELLQPLP
jgi:transcription antitermination factor NusG